MSKFSVDAINKEIYTFIDFCDEFTYNIPKVVYHYTTPDGVIGIISANRLWASNTLFLNDSLELEYAKNIILSEFSKIKKTIQGKEALSFLDSTKSYFIEWDNKEYYVICFCESNDQLSQWRNYAYSGSGYCIGFDTNHLPINKYHDDEPRLRKVIYSEKKQRKIVNDLLLKACDLHNRINKYGPSDFDQGYFGYLISSAVEECRYCFKHPSFHEEKEWRIIDYAWSSKKREKKFRPSNNFLIPYIELCPEDLIDKDGLKNDKIISKLPIKEIVYGPTLNKDKTFLSLKMITNKYEYENVKIHGSKTPLRT